MGRLNASSSGILSLSSSPILVFFHHRNQRVVACRRLPGCKVMHLSESRDPAETFTVTCLRVSLITCVSCPSWNVIYFGKLIKSVSWNYYSRFFPQYHPTYHPSVRLAMPRRCFKVEFVTLETGCLAGSHCFLTSLESLAFRGGTGEELLLPAAREKQQSWLQMLKVQWISAKISSTLNLSYSIIVFK